MRANPNEILPRKRPEFVPRGSLVTILTIPSQVDAVADAAHGLLDGQYRLPGGGLVLISSRYPAGTHRVTEAIKAIDPAAEWTFGPLISCSE